ncbi:hypothetical protein PtB15_7B572 [Puccinia triticina]|nr:hypothetical protein PtB15_7B572 [Puccinia triticina]
MLTGDPGHGRRGAIFKRARSEPTIQRPAKQTPRGSAMFVMTPFTQLPLPSVLIGSSIHSSPSAFTLINLPVHPGFAATCPASHRQPPTTVPSTESQSSGMRTVRRPLHSRVCLAAILLTLSGPHPSLSEPHRQQVLGPPVDHREPPPDSSPEQKDPSPNPVDELVRAGLSTHHLPDTPSIFSPSPLSQSIERLPPANLGNLTDPFVGRQAKSAPPASSLALFAPRPSPHPSTPQQVFQQIELVPIEDTKNLSTHSYSNTTSSLHHKRSFVRHRRDSNGPTQTWPGTDTVFATKTVFISQASPATTVYVSNGQIITTYIPASSSPTPYVNNPNNPYPGIWVTPSGNPNIVIATVTAMSSARKFVWDEYYTNNASWWAMMALINLFICFFTFLGFGFVSFGL